jgi:alginate O-acetyltransferase complex protein AlgI
VTFRSVDLSGPPFWIFVGVAIVTLRSITAPAIRRIAWFLINIAFVVGLVGVWGGFAVAVFAVIIHVAAKISCIDGSPRAFRLSLLAGASALTLALFVVRKLSYSRFQYPALSNVGQLLAAVGFSYVALRVVELLRAGAEGKAREFRWIDSINYLFPFHMLAAGPIQRWDDFVSQPGIAPHLDTIGALDGVDRIVNGLFKKFVLARAIELAVLTGFRAPWPYLLVEAQFYYLWVYLDFSAYSDIAIGAGRLMGVATPENFNKPLLARNIITFWERWHISLSMFIRRNVFIPLQLNLTRRTSGSRPGLAAAVAIGASFLTVGLWHGLALRYVLWGMFHATAVLLCVVYRNLLSQRIGRKRMGEYMTHPVYRAVATLITFEFVAFSLAFLAHPASSFLE